jgi:predicted amidophosphoribosyltransferase
VIDGVLLPRHLHCGATVDEPDALCGQCWAAMTVPLANQPIASFADRAARRSSIMQIATTLRWLDRFVVDGVLPPRCLACGETISDPDALCGPCWSSMTFFAPPWCANCGYV